MTRYPIDINAMTLVYLRESKRRRNDSGITISLGYSTSAVSHLNSHRQQVYHEISAAHSHETSHPKVAVDEKTDTTCVLTEALYNTGH